MRKRQSNMNGELTPEQCEEMATVKRARGKQQQAKKGKRDIR